MKKQLLLGSALLAAISAFPQAGRTKAEPKMVDFANKIASKYFATINPAEASPFQAPASTSPAKAQARTAVTSATVTSWNRYTGSENIYGMLVSNSKPIQYNDELGRVSFVHRKSHTYLASPPPAPTASTGVIVADITNSWGADWDSTVLWSNDTYWARYPQGGIYNTSPTNTNIANAYVLGSGPVTTAASSWQGNWFASRPLDALHGPAFNNVVSTVASGNQTFIPNSGTFGAAGKVDFCRLDFSSTDDGVVRSLGLIVNDANSTAAGTYGQRGAKIEKAVFNSTTHNFTWTSGQNDSIIFPARVNTNTSAKMLSGEPHMCWSEDGAVGYVWHIGCRTGATGNNVGYQPIIYKSTDHGASWTLLAGIDFNNTTAMAPVLKFIPAVTAAPTQTIPFFNTSEDADGIVDMNGKLHIMATTVGTSKAHLDSLGYSFNFPNSNDGQTYSYSHGIGGHPYIYDFVGDGTGAWSVITVDSMSSEAPGWAASTNAGFNSNPWDIDPTTSRKVDVNGRFQMSRTADGKYIVYTWSESDTTVTTGSVKWNISPNVKARLLNVATMSVHPNKINVTDPADPNNANAGVRGFAFNHYISPKCVIATTNTTSGIAIGLPMTVSNNSAIHQAEPIDHYYSTAALNFDNISETTYSLPHAPDRLIDGIMENAMSSAKNSVIFPNPAKNSAVLSIDMKDNAKVDVTVMNMVGQQVKASQSPAQIGQNKINVDLSGLTSGIYLVNVKVGNASSTKKLVVE